MLADESQREAISLAVDRAVIYNVIFQKQGEVTASLLPNAFTGYSFLFPVDRDLGRAQITKGAGIRAPLTLMVDDASAAGRLAADRIALNLQEAGFHVQVTNRTVNTDSGSTSDLVLRKLHRETGDSQSALQQMLGTFGQQLSDDSGDPAALYRQESAFLQTHFAIPLLFLPRAYAVGPRVRGLRLSTGGLPLIGDVSLEDTK
jgi:ABC-type transport system substrate-binding protein